MMTDQAPSSYQQKCPQNIEDKSKLFQQGCAKQNKACTHEQCAKDPPRQNTMLIGNRNFKVLEDHQKNKQVVYRQCFFDKVACDKIDSLFGTVKVSQASGKDGGEQTPKTVGQKCLCKAWRMTTPLAQQQIQTDEGEDPEAKSDPNEGGVVRTEQGGVLRDAVPYASPAEKTVVKSRSLWAVLV